MAKLDEQRASHLFCSDAWGPPPWNTLPPAKPTTQEVLETFIPYKKSLEGQDVALLPPQARLVVGSHLATGSSLPPTGSLLCGHLVSTEVTHSLSL